MPRRRRTERSSNTISPRPRRRRRTRTQLRRRVAKENYPFLLFRRSERSKLPRDLTPRQAARELSRRWDSASPSVKQRFRNKAKRLRRKYVREKRTLRRLRNLRRVRARRRKRYEPKRPQSAFFLFALRERPRIRRENPELSLREMGVELGRRWWDLPASERRWYRNRAARNRSKFRRNLCL
ncbi:high mobility group protein B1-like protein [Dinothrombium tinctorium]|uniref:High mobility group protein B1-like protein n=1 Tax=Dinothrombium tinctorium TaxID=1965070 RepID=A0A443QV86_9ACAR|nr:high mobility group protein B1-like protein [Dinothrombium tinctorium]